MKYTAVIRTLGTAGEKYQNLLDSLLSQNIKPEEIIVYIAEGYPLPKETVGLEKYIYVPKGMVAQRALLYREVTTDYILFLDDDVFLPSYGVELLFENLQKYHANVISPDVFPNAQRSFLGKLLMTFSGRMLSRKDDGIWAYRVMKNSGYSYNSSPQNKAYLSQTNAGACFFMRKEDFLKIHFEEELWMDQLKYAQGDDQVMYYKMYKKGLKQLTLFGSGIKHLDAGSTRMAEEKEQRVIYSDFFFKTVFWHRFIFLPEKTIIGKFWDVICLSYTLLFTLLISLIKLNNKVLKIKYSAITDAFDFLKSEEYKALPKI